MAIKTLGKRFGSETEAIRALQVELSKLEEKQSQQAQVLKDLPKKVDLSSVDELIHALADHASPSLRTKVLGKAARAKKKVARKKKAARKKTVSRKTIGKKAAKQAPKKAAGTGSRKRARLTADKVSQMKEAFTSKMTGPEIAKKFGVSESTVHNVKKRLGMTKG